MNVTHVLMIALLGVSISLFTILVELQQMKLHCNALTGSSIWETKMVWISWLAPTCMQLSLLLHLARLVMTLSGHMTATGANGTALDTAIPLIRSPIQMMILYALMTASTDIACALKATIAMLLKLFTESATSRRVSGTAKRRLHTSASTPSGAPASHLDLIAQSGKTLVMRETDQEHPKHTELDISNNLKVSTLLAWNGPKWRPTGNIIISAEPTEKIVADPKDVILCTTLSQSLLSL